MKKDFWSLFGRFAMLVGAFWALIQIFNFFFRHEYKANIIGQNYDFVSPTFIKPNLNTYSNSVVDSLYYKVFNKSVVDYSEYGTYTLEQKLKNYGVLNRLYTYIDDHLTPYILNSVNSYNSVWHFKIKNAGNKPLEELCLELPFSGIYNISNNDTKKVGNGDFNNRIDLGNLKPTYEINVIVWINNNYGNLSYQEDLTRVTHKYGSFNIKYVKEVSGLWVWFIDNIVTIILFILLIVLFILLFSGLNNTDNKEKRGKKKQEENDAIVVTGNEE